MRNKKTAVIKKVRVWKSVPIPILWPFKILTVLYHEVRFAQKYNKSSKLTVMQLSHAVVGMLTFWAPCSQARRWSLEKWRGSGNVAVLPTVLKKKEFEMVRWSWPIACLPSLYEKHRMWRNCDFNITCSNDSTRQVYIPGI